MFAVSHNCSVLFCLDADLSPADSESNEEDDDEDDKENAGSCSMVEYNALQKQLVERDQERDELAVKLKVQNTLCIVAVHVCTSDRDCI